MQKKTLLVIILTLVIFLSASALGVSTVYRVQDVTVCADTISDEAETEAAELQTRLLQTYKKSSIFDVDYALADGILADFPYFRLTSVQTVYPNHLIFNVVEDEEVYAISLASDAGYYILNSEGIVLSIRDDYTNRKETDAAAKNILLSGFTVMGEKGAKIYGDDALEYLFPFCQRVSNLLNGIRRNVVEIQLIKGGSSLATHILKITMLEGVTIYVRNPSALTETKAEKAINKYLSLRDGEHTKGMIVVYEKDAEVVAEYSPTDTFAE